MRLALIAPPGLRRLARGALALAFVGGTLLDLAASSSPRAQAGSGSPITGGTGLCSSGGCLPMSSCGKGGSLCSTFPDHPAYDPNEEFRRGVALLRAQDYPKAVAAFDRVLYLAPTNSDVLFAKGVAETGMSNLKAAAEDFERALKWSPRQINAARELAIVEVKLGRSDAARARLEALRERSARCAAACPDAHELDLAIEAVDAALAHG